MADAKEKNRQLEAEREKDAKERKDLENDIALLRSDLYSGTKSQQSGRSAEEVGANDGRDDFDGKDAKERKDLENDIALLRSDLYSGTKSQQSGRSAEEVGANDGRDDFDGTDASLSEANRKDDVSSEANSDGEKSDNSQSEEPDNSSEDRDSDKGTPETPTPKTIYHGPSRKGRTYNKQLQLLRQYIMVLLVRVVLIISIQLARRLSISAI